MYIYLVENNEDYVNCSDTNLNEDMTIINNWYEKTNSFLWSHLG